MNSLSRASTVSTNWFRTYSGDSPKTCAYAYSVSLFSRSSLVRCLTSCLPRVRGLMNGMAPLSLLSDSATVVTARGAVRDERAAYSGRGTVPERRPREDHFVRTIGYAAGA